MNDFQKMKLMQLARLELVDLRGVCANKNNGILGHLTYEVGNTRYPKDIDTICLENVLADIDYGIKLIDRIKLLLEGL